MGLRTELLLRNEELSSSSPANCSEFSLLCLECRRLWWVRERRVVYGMDGWEAQRELSGAYQLFIGKHTNQRTAEFTWHHLRSCCSPIEHTERRGEGRNRAALLSAQCGQTGKMCDSYTAGVLYPGGAKTGGYILQTCRASVTVQSGTPSPACSRAPLPLKLIIGGSTVSSCLSSSLRNISSSVKF